jgi:nickel-dependent lactate racemase
MSPVFRYGVQSSVELDLPEDVLVARLDGPRDALVSNAAAAVTDALAHPLDFPPLAKMTVPGDRVVLAVDGDVPRLGEVVASTVRTLVESQVDPNMITLLRPANDRRNGAEDPRCRLPDELARQVHSKVHDPADSSQLGYLATTKGGEAVRLNRAILDADVLLPIGCRQNAALPDYHGVHTPIYPAFSDARTHQRFRSLGSADIHGPRKRHMTAEVNEVGWLTGVYFAIQVVPGPEGGILHALAGSVDSVDRRGGELYGAAWTCSVPRQASLVVASIEGGPAAQSWKNLGRALAVAEPLVDDDGAIALCCDLAEDFGPAMKQLAGARSRQEAVRDIQRQSPDDAMSALELAKALDRVRVYLLSRLDAEQVEDLEVGAIANVDELIRLTRRHPSCILLSDAPHAVVSRRDAD